MRKFHKNITDKDPDPDPKRPAGRIRIRIQKDPRAGSGSEMTLQVGSGSEINSFGSQHWLSGLRIHINFVRTWIQIQGFKHVCGSRSGYRDCVFAVWKKIFGRNYFFAVLLLSSFICGPSLKIYKLQYKKVVFCT